jgi:indolepyruvate decarboxylase
LHTYTDVTLRDFIEALLAARMRKHREKVRYADNLPRAISRGRRIRVADVLIEVNRFLEDKKDYMVVAESGDMLFAGLDVRVPGSSAYLAQGYYASMGFGVPGAIGAQIARRLRPLVLCGDGAFQMTGPEIAQAPRHGANPIVIVMNNGGWGIFRPVVEREDLLTVPNWPYAQLAAPWGFAWWSPPMGLCGVTQPPARFFVISVMIDTHDFSPQAAVHRRLGSHRCK